jgi:hypothetical protein
VVLWAGSAGPLGLGLGLSPFLEVKEVPLFKERGCNNLGRQYQTNQYSFSSSFSVISSNFSTIRHGQRVVATWYHKTRIYPSSWVIHALSL